MKLKNFPPNELGLSSKGREIVEAGMLARMTTKDYPHLLPAPSGLHWVAWAAALAFRRLEEPAIISLDLISREKSMS